MNNRRTVNSLFDLYFNFYKNNNCNDFSLYEFTNFEMPNILRYLNSDITNFDIKNSIDLFEQLLFDNGFFLINPVFDDLVSEWSNCSIDIPLTLYLGISNKDYSYLVRKPLSTRVFGKLYFSK